MRLRLEIISALFFLYVITSSQTAPQKSTAKAPAPKPTTAEFAKWNLGWETLLGITETEFNKSGLEHLTLDQATTLFFTIYNHRPTLTCGVNYDSKAADEYHYVHLHVTGPDSDAEFVGRLRGNFSAIRDVRMATSNNDADLVINLLEVSNEVTSRRIGITVATNVTEPCIYQVNGGLQDGPERFQKLLDATVTTGGDDDEVATRIANSLEARDFDDIRQSHTNILKYIQK